MEGKAPHYNIYRVLQFDWKTKIEISKKVIFTTKKVSLKMPSLIFYEFCDLLCKNGFKWVIIGLLGLTHLVLGRVLRPKMGSAEVYQHVIEFIAKYSH